ncbi:MAG: CxxC-x17-CxxC domain-containing protein [Candidatus Paceibacterota bacterium]|jgi:CxxC-x17-CxxC domain-containing protein
MANFRQGGGNRFGDNRGGSRFGGGDRGGFRGGDREVKMHQAICAECRKSCEVPFRPTNERPVYCKDCFMNKGGPSGDNRGPRPDFNNRSFSKPQFAGNQGGNQGGADIKRQLEMINSKLDKLVAALSLNAGPKVPVVKEGLKESVAVATKSEAKDVPVKAKKTASKKSAKKK